MINIPFLTTFQDVVIGGYGSNYPATYADGAVGLIDTFASAFSSGFNILTDNPALLLIVAVAVGVPILGAILALFRGR